MADPHAAEDRVMTRANSLDRESFVATFGGLFEGSPWVAEGAWEQRPFADRDDLLAALCTAMYEAPRERRLALIRAHPDLAGRAATTGELTEASTGEQSAAGLDRLTHEEHARLDAANAAYRQRFGFPFVICAREHDRHSILARMGERLRNPPEHELRTALGEIAKIAGLRLRDMS